LSRAFVTNAQGRRVPLSELVRVQNTVSDRPIQRKNGERVSYVGGETDRIPPLYAVLDMDKRLDGMRLADGSQLTTGNMGLMPEQVSTMHGYRLFWDGQQRQMLDTYRDMLRALAVAITLLFLVLVAYYQSFSLPAVAMMAIPLGLVGVAPGHWIMQQQFSATSIVGVIALAGVVVRNSLLIIDFVLEYRDKGRPLREAILDACAIRLRPIMLTALAIVLGSAVMLSDPLFVGLAISLIFGTIAATVLTLIVIPVLLYLLLRWKEHRAGQQI
jgi:multidrug efflux pump subunit AcrB